MKRISIALATALWGVILSAPSSAQPILNRVEQLLRNQAAAAQNPAAPQAAEAAEPGYLGVIADDRLDGGRGVRVLEVAGGGPAANGGVQNGDLITAINGQSVRVMEDMARALERLTAGTRLTITVERAGKPSQQEITLGRRPRSQPIGKIPENLPEPSPSSTDATPPGPRLGVRSLPVSEDAQRQNNLPNANGATVISVTVGSPADRAEIPLGAVITAVNDKPIASPQELAAAVRASGDDVELTMTLRGQELRKRVSLAAKAPSNNAPKLELRGKPPSPPDADPPAFPKPNDDVAELAAQIQKLEQRIEKLEAAILRERK